MGVAHGNAQRVEEVVQLGVVGSEIHQPRALLQHQVANGVVVVALVLAADDENHLRAHALQRIPTGVHVGGFRVVDVVDTAHRGHPLQAVLHTGEIAQALADVLLAYAADVRGDARGQRVVDVVLAGEAQLLLLHVERGGVLYLVLALLYVANAAALLQLGERALHGLDVVFLQLALDDGVVVPINKGVVGGLVLNDAHLGVHVVLHAVVVAVQMVGGDVQQNGNVGAEVVHIVQLKRTQLDDVVFVRILGHLQGQRVAYVAGQSGIVACIAEDVVDEAGGGGLAVRAGDANHLGVGVASCKLYLADDVRALVAQFLHHGRRVGNAGTLNHLVGVQNLGFGVAAFFPLYLVVVHQTLVLVLDFRHVRYKHVESFFLGQYGGTSTTLAGTQYHYSFHILFLLLLNEESSYVSSLNSYLLTPNSYLLTPNFPSVRQALPPFGRVGVGSPISSSV